MLSSLLLLAVCLVSLVALAGLVIGIIVIVQSNQRDTVSSAREGWINRRSEKDEDE